MCFRREAFCRAINQCLPWKGLHKAHLLLLLEHLQPLVFNPLVSQSVVLEQSAMEYNRASVKVSAVLKLPRPLKELRRCRPRAQLTRTRHALGPPYEAEQQDVVASYLSGLPS